MNPAQLDHFVDMTLLKRSWQHACHGLAIVDDSLASSTYQQLTEHYNQPERAYHNLQHLTECFQHLYAYPHRIDHFAQLEMALWFHDVIYNPQSTSNEQDSANWAVNFLQACHVASQDVQLINTLIMTTQHHQATTNLEKLMIDIDLLILASSATRFKQYEQQIRSEYQFVPNDVFAVKRKEILQHFYERSFIYQTDYFHQNFEQQARINLSGAIHLV